MGYKSVKIEDLFNEKYGFPWHNSEVAFGTFDLKKEEFIWKETGGHAKYSWDLLGEDPKETKARRIKNIKI